MSNQGSKEKMFSLRKQYDTDLDSKDMAGDLNTEFKVISTHAISRRMQPLQNTPRFR